MTATVLPESFWALVDRRAECWLWLGPTWKGYGRASIDGRSKPAHRLAWEAENGQVPDGLVLDHACRNRACVRPDHLEPVTNRVNVLRGVGPTARNARKTKCSRGHSLTPENTRYVERDGCTHRVCRECAKAMSSAHRKRRVVCVACGRELARGALLRHQRSYHPEDREEQDR